MISDSEIVELQLDAAFGSLLPVHIKSIVNRELDAGIWLDGYDAAVTQSALCNDESIELLKTILKDNPGSEIDIKQLSSLIEKNLPQVPFVRLSWLVAEDATFVVTDTLRVAKFYKSNLLWCSSRISYDGIKLLEIKNKEIHGLSWHLSSSYNPDEPFVLDLVSGRVIKGNVVG